MMQVRDRVKELRRVPAADLRKNPRNWRTHGEAQTAALRAMLSEIGFAGALLARELPDGSLELIDGHLRTDLTSDATVPVLVLDLTEAESRKLLLTFDPIAAMAEADNDALKSLMDEWKTDNPALQALFDHTAKEYDILVDGGVPLEEPPTQIDKAAEFQEKWGTELGQLWEIGPHRLLCGDNRNNADTSLLIHNDHFIDLGVTSPPYAVGKEYEANVSFTQHLNNLRQCAIQCLRIIKPGGFLFTNFGEIAAQSHAGPLTGSARQCVYPISKDYWQIFHEELGCDLYAQRIWYKPFNRLQQPFWTYHTSIPHYQEWEHIWTWRLPGGNGDQVYDWDISVHAIWDTRTESTNDKPLTRHTAAFPVGIPERAIRAHSRKGALIYDPYCGSGTTLVAAHQLNRVGYGIEMDPGYVAVALERLSLLGLTPKLINGPTA